MLKKLMTILLILLVPGLLAVEAATTQIKPLNDVAKPERIRADKTHLYILEGTTIYIYSLTDFKFFKKFGKEGRGPDGFISEPQYGGMDLNVTGDEIVINSLNKLSWYTKDGNFVDQIQLPYALILFAKPFGKNFVATNMIVGEKSARQLNLYDNQFKPIKTIAESPHPYQPGKGLKVLTKPWNQQVYDNKLFIATGQDILINVLDVNLRKLYTITHTAKKQSVTEADKKKILQFLETDTQTRGVFSQLKPVRFPKYFPSIRQFMVTGGKIYINTYKTKDNGKQSQFLIF
ncbi:MAG: hypothetical protein GY940_44070, partial [bacterium]|nr:hypothetical protein [bacterium]